MTIKNSRFALADRFGLDDLESPRTPLAPGSPMNEVPEDLESLGLLKKSNENTVFSFPEASQLNSITSNISSFSKGLEVNSVGPDLVRYSFFPDTDYETAKDRFKRTRASDNQIVIFLEVTDLEGVKRKNVNSLEEANLPFSKINQIVGVRVADSILRSWATNSKKHRSLGEFAIDITNKMAPNTIGSANRKSLIAIIKDFFRQEFTNYIKENSFDIVNAILVQINIGFNQFWAPILNALADEIDSFKTKEENWNPLVGDEKFDPLFVPDYQESLNKAIAYFQKLDESILRFLDEDHQLDKKITNLPNFETFEFSYKEVLRFFYELIKDLINPFFNAFVSIFKEVTKYANYANAFICGLYDGIINFITGTIRGLAFILTLSDRENVTAIKQALINYYNEITKDGIVNGILKEIQEAFEKLGNRYSREKSSYEIIKQIGEDLLVVGEVITGILAAVRFIKTVKAFATQLAKRLNEARKKAQKKFKKDIDELDDNITKSIKEKGSSEFFAKKVSKIFDDAPEEIISFEKRIQLFDIEFGKIFNKNTRVDEFFTSNLKDRIIWPDKILLRSRQAIMTHNHPSGFGLSIADIKFFLSNRLNEIRAVTPNGSTFSLKKGKNLKVKEIKKLIDRIEDIESNFNLAKKLAVGNTGTINHREFEEIFDILKDKVIYNHYIN
ncbi:hypothetical protein GTQ40_08225 [Flavobacteriaceae bacterium R38]|nr:hypothetical protein [Flavobacteriaceae bacterium R38]